MTHPRDPSEPDSPAADVIALPRRVSPPAVTAIVSGKGGVGVTHIAVNLACVWRSAGYSTLVVDGDAAVGDADLLLGVAPLHTVADVVDGRVSAADAIATANNGVQLLAASAGDPEFAVLGKVRRHRLLVAIDALPRYDAIVLDTPTGLSADALEYCACASQVIAVVTPDPASVEATCAWLSALANQTQVRRVWILTNLVDDAAAGREVFRRVVRRTDDRPAIGVTLAMDYLGAVPADPAVGRATLRGEPFCVTAPACAAASALRRAADLLGAASNNQPRAVGGGLFWSRPDGSPGAARPQGAPAY